MEFLKYPNGAICLTLTDPYRHGGFIGMTWADQHQWKMEHCCRVAFSSLRDVLQYGILHEPYWIDNFPRLRRQKRQIFVKAGPWWEAVIEQRRRVQIATALEMIEVTKSLPVPLGLSAEGSK